MAERDAGGERSDGGDEGGYELEGREREAGGEGAVGRERARVCVLARVWID